MWNWFVSGAILSGIFVTLAIAVFPRIGLLDFPLRYHLKRKPIPYPGGLILSLLSLLIAIIDPHFWIVVPPIITLTTVSFIDDRKGLPISTRTLIFIICALWTFYHGVKIDFIGIPWQETNLELAPYFWLTLTTTLIWVFFIQQAMNWFDGIGGLCVGVSGIGFLTLGLLGILRPELFFDQTHTSLTLANFFLAGLCLGGFHWFWKGKILLGDTGSQVLGYLLAIMAIWSGAKIMTTLIVLALPLIDIGFVVFRRIVIEKKSPLSSDLKHLHHNLSKKIGERKACLSLLFLTALFGGISVYLTGTQKLISLALVGIITFSLCSILTFKKDPSQQ